MTLKELKRLVAEEYTAYKNKLNEQPAPMDMPGINVTDNDVDATGGGNAEDTLQKIFDMLSDYFEKGDDAADDAADAPEDVEGEEDEEADIEEAASTGFGDAGSKKTSGANVGFKTVKESKALKTKALLEEVATKARFKKLANIK